MSRSRRKRSTSRKQQSSSPHRLGGSTSSDRNPPTPSPNPELQAGISLYRQGQLAEAEACFQAVLDRQPENSHLWHIQGTIAAQQKQFPEAILRLDRARQLSPDEPEIYNTIGKVRIEQQQFGAAIESLQHAIALNPTVADYHVSLGQALKADRQLDEAIDRFQRAIELDPNCSQAYGSLGVCFQTQGELERAMQYYEQALTHDPSNPTWHNNLGNVLKDRHHYADAIQHYRQGLDLHPDNSDLWVNLGSTLQTQGQLTQAVEAYKTAIHLHPTCVAAHNNLGSVFQAQNRFDEAIRCYQMVLDLAPDFSRVRAQDVICRRSMCEWEGLAEIESAAIAAARTDDWDGAPWPLLAVTDDPALHLAAARSFCRNDVGGPFPALWQGERYQHDKIQLAYLSADFHDHATAYLMAELFERHDRDRFELTAISFGPESRSDMRQRLVCAFDRCLDVRSLPNEDVARQMRELEIDIAIDLKGHTNQSRPQILAYRPAPIQVSYLGYPGSMGADFIDYILVDPFIVPPSQQQYYSEQLVQLPDCYQVNDSKRTISKTVPTRQDCGLPETGFVFCSFNSSYKIEPTCFDIWMRLLKAVPNSVLWLIGRHAAVVQNLRKEATLRGVNPDRLVFATRQPLANHLARHQLADLFLDSWPCGAHTTASDALWAGLPVLTYAGRSFASRVAGSLLTAAGLPELVVESWQEYEAMALSLATQPKRLQDIKTRLLKNRDTSPLFDCDRFHRYLESAYHAMWTRWQRGESPAGFAVAAAPPSESTHVQSSEQQDDIDRTIARTLRAGIASFQAGHLELAAQHCEALLTLHPQHFDAWHLLGLIAAQQNDVPSAIARLERAIQLCPDCSEARINLGLLLKNTGQLDRAVDTFQAAIEAIPTCASAHEQLGRLLTQQEQYDRALAMLELAQHLQPDNHQIYLYLGFAHQKSGHLTDAMNCFRTAIRLQPDDPQPHWRLGSAHKQQREFDAAIACYQQALDLNPDYHQVLYDLGTLHKDRQQLDRAIPYYQQALAVAPDYLPALTQYVYTRRLACDWRDLEPYIEQLLQAAASPHWQDSAWILLGLTDRPELHLKAARSYCRNTAASHSVASPLPPATPDRHSKKRGTQTRHNKIRLAYLSADFYDHATAYLMAELFERHNRDRFEVIAISFSPDSSSVMRQRLEAAFDRFIDVRQLSDRQAADLLVELNIDIAIDLKGYTKDTRSSILAHRPAPIQVNYLGYPGSMGADFMDYVVVDAFIAPPERQQHYSECLVHLPDCYQVNDGQREISPAIASKTDYGLPEDGFVFCSFNKSYKLESTCFDIWMRLLKAVPGSVLWLLESNPLMAENLRREARSREVNPDRLVFAPKELPAIHLARHQYADLFLDSWPCCAHTTASDALWAGLPVLTYAGQSFASRVAGSLLTTLGLSELVTQSWQDYEAIALELATHPEQLQAIQDKLRRNRETSSLFDCDRFCRHLESAYQTMWTRWQQGQSPAAFAVEAIEHPKSHPDRNESNPTRDSSDWLHQQLNQAEHYIQTGQLADAIRGYQHILQAHPDEPQLHAKLADIFTAQGQREPALSHAQHWVRLQPDNPHARNCLGLAYQQVGQLENAIAQYRAALTFQPDYPQVCNRMGSAYKATGDIAAAIACYQAALELKPNYYQVLHNLGGLYREQQQLDKSISAYQQAVAANPDYLPALVQYVYSRRLACDWHGLQPYVDRVLQAAASDRWQSSAWIVLGLADQPELHLQAARSYCRNAIGTLQPPLHPDKPYRHDKIRLAYLSADFHDHATAYLMAELFERHDRDRFEVYAVSFGPDSDCAMRQRLQAAFDSFTDVRQLSDRQVADLLVQWEIDIAIDLKGFTRDMRPHILAHRPAPIQVNYLGYPGSMGAEFIDYVLVDSFIVPAHRQEHYSERLVHLPDCYQVNDGQRHIAPTIASKTEYGLPEDGFVFCSFNKAYKIESTCFEIWMRLLQAVPGSVLWLLENNPLMVKNLRQEARSRGVEPERLVFAPKAPLDIHLARHQYADVFLDSWPCCAHTTASDALWAGLPLLTYAGQSFASRVAGSLLSALGLPELVVESWKDYEAVALELATHPERLRAIRDQLARSRQTSALFDCDRFCHHLESAYQTMWTRWQQGQAPAAFAVEEIDRQEASPDTTAFNTARDSSGWLHQQLNQAEHYIQAGQLSEAVQYYRDILQQRPDNPQAHAKLAELYTPQGQWNLVHSHADRWVVQQPDNPQARNYLGLAYQQLGQLDSAIEQYQAAITLQPNYPQVHSRLGGAYKAAGDLELAIASYRQALQYKPDYPQALNNLGNALKQVGQWDEAIDCFHKALKLQPDYVKALNSLGLALQEQGRHQEALGYHQQALDIAPHDPQAHHNLGLALHAQGQLEAAIRAHHQALKLDPNYQKAHNNLGVALQELGQYKLAMQHYRTALELQPDNPHALNNLGNTLQTQGQLTEAIAYYRQAIALQPDYPQALNNLAIVLQAQGMLGEALEQYRQVIALQPDFPGALVPYYFCRRSVCDWRGLEVDAAKVIAAAGLTTWDASPWKLLAIADRPDLQLAAARSYCRNRLMTSTPPIWQGERYQHDKIRLAYLSADFHDHATAYLMAELFERHDRDRFDLTAISFGPDSTSAMRQRLVNAFDRFIDVRQLSDLDAARQLRKLEIDIAVDLKGYTRDARTQILAHRPAPIQVNYLGHPGSMGAEFMDYILVDPFIVPPDQQPHFSEQLVHLPDCYQVNDGTRAIADETPTRSECGLPETGFVFCSFNNSYKLEPTCFSIWMRLLNAVPDSVLWLLKSNAWVEANLRREATARGVNPKRLVFADKVPLPQHLARHRLADLFLDSWPCCAHTTASDALWVGLPVLTYAGQSFASRVAGSLLHAMGLPELVTHTWDDYESLALQLATHPQQLQQLRDRLEQNRETSPLFNCDRFCNHLESAYETMWFHWQQGKSPQAFAVTPVEDSERQRKTATTDRPHRLSRQSPPQSDRSSEQFTVTELHRGLNLIRSSQLEQAETCLNAVLTRQPECFDAWQLLGAIALKQQQPEIARARLVQALKIHPTSAEARSNLGLALRDLEQLPEAIAQFRLAVQHNPNFPDAFNNLGLALREHGQPQEAISAYQQAIALKPDYGDAITNLAKLYQDRGELAEAAQLWQTVLNLRPQQPEALLNYVYCRRLMCDWQGLEPMQQAAIATSTTAPTNGGVWYLLGMTDDPSIHWQATQQYVRHRFRGDYPQLWQGERYQHGKIRLAYLSADFHEHATAYLMAELFERHDRDRFEIVAISYGPADCSPMRQRLERGFDRFIDASTMSDRQAAEFIRELEVDIAIDLKGYTKCERTPILAYRPAPIQVNYLGYPGTMGTDFIDYIVVDPWVVPGDQQPYFSEQLVHLPDCYQVNDSQREIAARSPSRQDCGLPERGFVFCSFNNAYKLDPNCFDVWMRLLQRVPDSVLWLLESNAWMVSNLRQEASHRDVNPGRLVFAPRLPSPEHLARQPLADLFLDSWPYGAHTTTSDALRVGLPVVTLMGRSFASRVAGSLLHAVELPELVTNSWADYEAIAYQLATQPEAMRAVCAQLEHQRQTSPLFDCDRFRRHIESAYETMWSHWQDGLPPQAFRVQPLSPQS